MTFRISATLCHESCYDVSISMQRITSSPSSRSHAGIAASSTANAATKPTMADYHLSNNRSPSLSPTQPLPPPFQRHLNNSNSTTPSPAPPQQPLQQPSSFDAQNAINNTSPPSSQIVPLTTSNLIASSSALDLNVGAAQINAASVAASAAGPTLPSAAASNVAVKQTSTPSYSNLLGNSTSGYLTSSSTTNANRSPLTTAANTTTFDYLYEFSETRKVLEDFFKCPNTDEDKKIPDCFNESDTGSFVSSSTFPQFAPRIRRNFCSYVCLFVFLQDNLNDIDDSKKSENNYIGQRLAKVPSSGNNKDYSSTYHSPRTRYTGNNYMNHQQVSQNQLVGQRIEPQIRIFHFEL